jgi:hypothetical protein
MKQNTFNRPDQFEQRLVDLENQVRDLNKILQNFFLQGRLRTDRAAPTSSTDIAAGIDKLYDRVITTTYEYILLNNAGTLQWKRVSISTF